MKDIEFGRVIGRGSFAVVHKGYWCGKEVALKRIQLPSGSDLTTLTTPKGVNFEVRHDNYVHVHDFYAACFSYCRNLSHPNIISLLAYVVSKEEIVLITNYVKGCNLDRILFGSSPKEVTCMVLLSCM
jgi:serine/threonine protein kinase